jgi:hypothetical protein
MKEHAAKVIILDLDYKNVRLKKPSGSIVEWLGFGCTWL